MQLIENNLPSAILVQMPGRKDSLYTLICKTILLSNAISSSESSTSSSSGSSGC